MSNKNVIAMKVPHNLIITVSGIIVPTAFAFLQEAVYIMIPWIVTMFFVILADLAAGVWKSYKLGIKVRFSRGLRETMGKMLVYLAFVGMVACINVALKGEFQFAKWASVFVILIEFGSVISNILKPHGINISLTSLLRAVLQKSPLPITCDDANNIVRDKALQEIIEEEKQKAAIMGTSKTKPKKKEAQKTAEKPVVRTAKASK